MEERTTSGEQKRGRRRAALGLAWSAALMWCIGLWPLFPGNPADVTAILSLVWLGLYGVVLLPVAALVVWGIGRVSAGRRALARLGASRVGAVALGMLLIGAGVAGPLLRLHQHQVEEAAPPLNLSAAWGPSPLRVILLGLDGLDPEVLSGLMEEGRLPAFRRLVEGGVFGTMTTVSPHSPVVWTSIATGQPLQAHGVRSYTTAWLEGTGVALPKIRLDPVGGSLLRALRLQTEGAVSSNERRVKAAWELFTQLDLSSLVINWWATYPAEAIRGVMVSNHLVPWNDLSSEALARQRRVPGLVAPEALTPGLLDDLTRFVEAHGHGDLERDAFTVAGHGYYQARDALIFQLFQQMRGAQYTFATTYLQGVDTASHAYTTLNFGPNVNQRRPPLLPEAEAKARFEALVVAAYGAMDERLAELLGALGPDECLVVVSDHGWRYDGTSHWNKPDGVFMAIGGPFRQGVRVTTHVFDVLPTVAHLLGVPQSAELPGQVLSAALDPTWFATHPPVEAPTWGPRGRRVAVVNAAEEESHVERLRSLGYVE